MTTLTPVTLALIAICATTPALSVQSAAPIPDPAFHFAGSGGCADVYLYTWNAPRSEVLTAYINIRKLGLGVGTHVIDIASAGDAVVIKVDQYRDPDLWTHDCSDLGPFSKPVATWHAVAGQLTLTIGERGGVSGAQPFMYTASLRVEGLTIMGPDRRKLAASAPVVLTGTVGWVAG
jgi:hypothetical protein